MIGIRADETDGANHQNQNHCKHHGILRDILPAVVSQNLGQNTHFLAIPFNRENPDSRLEMPTLQKTERGWIRHPCLIPLGDCAPAPTPCQSDQRFCGIGSRRGIQQISNIGDDASITRGRG